MLPEFCREAEPTATPDGPVTLLRRALTPVGLRVGPGRWPRHGASSNISLNGRKRLELLEAEAGDGGGSRHSAPSSCTPSSSPAFPFAVRAPWVPPGGPRTPTSLGVPVNPILAPRLLSCSLSPLHTPPTPGAPTGCGSRAPPASGVSLGALGPLPHAVLVHPRGSLHQAPPPPQHPETHSRATAVLPACAPGHHWGQAPGRAGRHQPTLAG